MLAIGVLVELLLADEVHLDAESAPVIAFPNRVHRGGMRGRQGNGTSQRSR